MCSDASVYALIGDEHSAESDGRGDLLVSGDSLSNHSKC